MSSFKIPDLDPNKLNLKGNIFHPKQNDSKYILSVEKRTWFKVDIKQPFSFAQVKSCYCVGEQVVSLRQYEILCSLFRKQSSPVAKSRGHRHTKKIESQNKKGRKKLDPTKEHIEEQLRGINDQAQKMESMISGLSKDIGDQIQALSVTVNNLKEAVPVKNESSGKPTLVNWGPTIVIILALFAFYVFFNNSLMSVNNNVTDKLMGFKDDLSELSSNVNKQLSDVKDRVNDKMEAFSTRLDKFEAQLSLLPQTIIDGIRKTPPEKQ